MNIMKKNYILLVFLITYNLLFSQVAIGKTTVDPSAVLEVSNLGNRGVLLPRIDIVDILNNSLPIASPAEGLLVYNKGNSISPGLYLWQNNKWNQIADTYNLVSYLILHRTTNYSVLAGTPNGTFKNFDDAAFTVLKNDIGASYDNSTGYITLPGNSGYLVNVCFNIATTQESTTAGIANGPLQLHQYIMRLIDPSTGTQYGKSISINATSIANTKVHTLNLSFSFVTTSSTTIKLMPSLAHANGGTYQSGSGGNSPNNGEIIITNAKIDIQRSALNQ